MTDPELPDDENAAVLRHMAARGIDLTIPRTIEFAHLAPDESAARAIADAAEMLGYEVEVLAPDDEALEDGETDWDVICSRRMSAEHANITRCERELAAIAAQHGGVADGWGFAE